MPGVGTLLHVMTTAFLVTCEHGGNRVPPRYRDAFARAGDELESHRGWDEGALVVAREMARALDAPLLACTMSRLLIDTNRPQSHRSLFSEHTRSLPKAERDQILERWWRPHWTEVEDFIRSRPTKEVVLHVSVHSFTPSWKGREREFDLGFLYDPSRRLERSFVNSWSGELRQRDRALRVRRNQPYRGTACGLTTSMRRHFGEAKYAGVELELNQKFPRGETARWTQLRRDVVGSLVVVLDAEREAQWNQKNVR